MSNLLSRSDLPGKYLHFDNACPFQTRSFVFPTTENEGSIYNTLGRLRDAFRVPVVVAEYVKVAFHSQSAALFEYGLPSEYS